MADKIDKNIDVNFYTQLYNKLKSEIIKKNSPNSKFYSVRQVAIKFDVNVNTVVKVYKMLERDGYISSEKRKGYFIKASSDLSVSNGILPIMESFHYGQLSTSGINFSNGTPSNEFFPLETYKELMDKALKEKGSYLLGYQDIKGLESLREVLSDYLEKRDIFVNKDDIIIASGTQQAIVIILNTFANSAPITMAITEPTYSNAINLFRNTCNVKVFKPLNDGWDMVEFENELKKERIHFVYIVTNFQNPTGITWSEEKKKKLIKLAEEYNFYIIEDDCFSEFSYGKKVTSLKTLDKTGNEKVIYIKTYSKLLMPGIGLAFMITPPALMKKILLTKYSIDHSTSGLNQKILEYFIKDGYLDTHLKKLKKLFKMKYQRILELLMEVPHIKILNKPKGGFFIWIELADYINEEKFYQECKTKGLSILPGNIFYYNSISSGKIRLSFVSPSLEEIEKGVNIMKEILNNYNFHL